MSRSCVCDGNNENCRFCCGTGVLPDLDRLWSVRRRPIGKLARPPVNLIPCPKGCGASLKPSNLSRHLTKAHPAAPVVPPKPESPTQSHIAPNDIWHKCETCSVCEANVRTDRMEKHMAKAHKRTLATHQQPTPASSNEPSSTTGGSLALRCPFCGMTLNVDRVRKHITRAHRNTLSYQLMEEAIRKLNIAHENAQASPHEITPELIRHRAEAKETTNVVSSSTGSSATENSLPMTICLKCKARVRKDRLERHIRRAHSGRKKSKKRKKRRKKKSDARPYLRIVSGGLPGLGKRR
jgi:hypothetical protein